MEFITALSIICMTLFGVLGLYLFFKASGKSSSNKLLGLFFLLMVLNFLDGSLMLSGFYLNFPNLAFIEDPNVFLYGPILFFYAKSITIKDFRWRIKDLLHLIPFILLFILILFSVHIKSPEYKRKIISSINQFHQPNELIVPVVLVFLHIFIYIYFAKNVVHKYHQQLKNYYSSFNTVWLNKTLNFIIVILVFSFGTSILQVFSDEKVFQYGLIGLIILVLVFIIRIYFNALEQPELFKNNLGIKSVVVDELESEEIQKIKTEIEEKFKKENIHLNPTLTVEDLSMEVGYPSRKVSQVINDVFGQNFFDLVNTYRINYATERLRTNHDKGLTVLEIMYESGFNSKSSFNTQFKKKTGLTPTEFKKLYI